jgi:hypothetical protein
MWESENQDESPLMTTDNFHGIDRLEGGGRRPGMGMNGRGGLSRPQRLWPGTRTAVPPRTGKACIALGESASASRQAAAPFQPLTAKRTSGPPRVSAGHTDQDQRRGRGAAYSQPSRREHGRTAQCRTGRQYRSRRNRGRADWRRA